MRKKIGIIIKNNPVIPSLLIITLYSILSYLPLIPFLGFYNDDWLFAYLGHFFGSKELINGFAGDRPLVGYLFAINHFLLKENVLFWHIYMFLMRLLGGFILFFLLKKLWPNRLVSITGITLLFLVYPGFLQQMVPLGDQNYFTALTAWMASLLLTVFAIKNRNKITSILFTIVAIFLQIISFSLVEIFIGMEVFRLLLIVYADMPLPKGINLAKLKGKIKSMSPYIISLTLFILWRAFIFKGVRTTTDISWVVQTYYSNPIWVAEIPLKVLYSFLSTALLAYFIPIIIRLTRIPLESSIISFSIGIIFSAVLYFYYKTSQRFENDQSLNNSLNTKKWGKKLLLIGFISILSTLTFVIILGRYVSVFSDNSNFDRYSVSSIVSVAFILIGFLLYKTPVVVRNWIIILLATISVTTHLMNGYWYKIIWDKQKDIWWQLYWRAPKIKGNSLLIFDFPKDQNTSTALYKSLRLEDYQIWAPGNLFLNYNNSLTDHFRGQYLSSEGTDQKIRNKATETIAQESSTIRYTNDFNNIILISLPSKNSCLWVLDKEKDELPDNSNELLKSNFTYSSDINKIIKGDSNASSPPVNIFGNEPSQSWCYYFQKASLARQLEDWDKIDKITQEVLDRGFKPKDANEWLPFIEGLVANEQALTSGNKKYSKAESLIKVASEGKSKAFSNNLCQMINRLDVIEFKKYCD